MYWIGEMMKIPQDTKEGEDPPEVRTQLRRNFYAYIGCIYDLVIPDYIVKDEMTFRVFLNKYSRFRDCGGHMPITNSRLLRVAVNTTVFCLLA